MAKGRNARAASTRRRPLPYKRVSQAPRDRRGTPRGCPQRTGMPPRPRAATRAAPTARGIVLAARPRPSFQNSSHVTCPPKRGARRRKREFRVCETKTERWVSVFLFATPHSPLATPINQGSGTPTDAGSVSASFDAAPPSERPSLFEGGTEGGSPVGVPPRFSPKGVVVPKARLQAKASCDSAGASGPVSSPQPGGADLAQFERA
jgi:hypothetical protein